MERTTAQRQEIAGEGRCRDLAVQLRLLEEKRGEIQAMHRRGAGPDDALANDLAGTRFVLRAALLAGGLTEAKREEPERSEHEARKLLRRVVTGTGGAGGGSSPGRQP